ncbi:MAG: glycerol kinase [Acidimicrobiia bacterium]|nr:glycerol kinase [Acidimicrobiia bacterium]
MSILVIDVGTSGVRAAVVTPDAEVTAEHYRELLPDSPAGGLVEFDAAAMATVVMEVAQQALADGGPVAGVGVTNQRASTVVWDRATSVPVGPALGWQDLRTLGDCLAWRAEGLAVAPNHSATKLVHLLDAHDPDRTRDLCFGTVDTWVAWVLSEGALHVTDASNAAITALTAPLRTPGGDTGILGWDAALLERFRIPEAMLPTIVDSTGALGPASALPGAPPICGLAGDQQASMIGQGVVSPGPAKITFGTGGMLDLVLGPEPPAFTERGAGGTFPIVAWSDGGRATYGLEGVMLSAGTNVEWLRDDLGVIPTAAASHEVAAGCEDTGGVVYVPALLGLGTPHWDYGARGTMVGLTRGTGRAELVRAVLEGVAHRGADLVEAAETDAGRPIEAVRIDGGMSDNATFVQAVANATQRPVEVAPVTEATTLGAAFLAGLAAGTWGSWDDVAASWRPRARVEPTARLDRDRWQAAVAAAGEWIPELSSLDF